MKVTRDEERRAGDLTRILEVTRAMAAEKDLGELLALLVHRTSEVMDAERSSLFLVDREKGELWSKVAEGDGFAEIRFPVTAGLAGHCARTGETIRIADAYDDERFNPEVDRKTGYRTRSVLCMPLVDHDDEIVGVIHVLNKRGGRFTDYDEWLLGALSAQAGVSLSQAALLEQVIEKKRMQRDLELARSIQQGLLPDSPPAADGFEFATHFESCDETGGDYLDFLVSRGEVSAVGAVIADVAGHGLPAALMMSAVRATVHALWEQGLAPERIVAMANALLEPDLSPDRFVSMFLVSLERRREVTYVSAGHEPPILWRASEGEFETLDPTGPIIGVMQGAEYGRGATRSMGPGDMLFISTDGVFEARDPAGEMFGRDRLRESIRRSAGSGAAAVSEGVARRRHNVYSCGGVLTRAASARGRLIYRRWFRWAREAASSSSTGRETWAS